MEDCLYGMMLESANEVCIAVAEHISGSVDAFVELMNQKAASLGCTNTHFTNPNGLPDENHYTTAHDMAQCNVPQGLPDDYLLHRKDQQVWGRAMAEQPS